MKPSLCDSRLVIAWGQGERRGRRRGYKEAQGKFGALEVMDMFIILTMVMC